MTTIIYVLLAVLVLLLILLFNYVSDRSIKRKATALSEEIERYIEAEVEIRLEEARIAGNDEDRQHSPTTG